MVGTPKAPGLHRRGLHSTDQIGADCIGGDDIGSDCLGGDSRGAGHHLGTRNYNIILRYS